MANPNGRLKKELDQVGKQDSSGVFAKAVSEDMRHLHGTIQGPEGTVYDGGIFEVDIVIPKNYPFEPPKMKFLTKIWHPNVSSQTGAICLVSTREVSNEKIRSSGRLCFGVRRWVLMEDVKASSDTLSHNNLAPSPSY